jgi:hypothetical protein
MNIKTPEQQSFSFTGLVPSVGDLARMEVGTVVYYEVPDFKVAGNIQTYASSAGGRLSTTAINCFDARSPSTINKLLRVEVIETAPPKQKRGKKTD